MSRSKTGSWLGRGDGGFLGGRPRFRLGGEVEMVRVVTVSATVAVAQAVSGGRGGGIGSGCVRLSKLPSPGEEMVPGVGKSLALGGRPRLLFSTGDRMDSGL